MRPSSVRSLAFLPSWTLMDQMRCLAERHDPSAGRTQRAPTSVLLAEGHRYGTWRRTTTFGEDHRIGLIVMNSTRTPRRTGWIRPPIPGTPLPSFSVRGRAITVLAFAALLLFGANKALPSAARQSVTAFLSDHLRVWASGLQYGTRDPMPPNRSSPGIRPSGRPVPPSPRTTWPRVILPRWIPGPR